MTKSNLQKGIVSIDRFYNLCLVKKKIKFPPPFCWLPDIEIENNKKAKTFYNWMRLACYQYSVLNVILSVIMMIILFLDHKHTLKVKKFKNIKHPILKI